LHIYACGFARAKVDAVATKPKPGNTAKAIRYFQELVVMVEAGDQEQIEKLHFLHDAVKRYDKRKAKKGSIHIPGQRGIVPDDDIMHDGLTRAGQKPPSSYGRK
jgi:hypothetical protein